MTDKRWIVFGALVAVVAVMAGGLWYAIRNPTDMTETRAKSRCRTAMQEEFRTRAQQRGMVNYAALRSVELGETRRTHDAYYVDGAVAYSIPDGTGTMLLTCKVVGSVHRTTTRVGTR